DKLMLARDVSHSDGPVSVEISYRVNDAERDIFIRTAYTVGQSRRRNGAQNWRLYRDLGEANLYVERFIVESWLEYLRQRARVTRADESRENRLQRFRCDTQATRRYIYQAPSASDQ